MHRLRESRNVIRGTLTVLGSTGSRGSVVESIMDKASQRRGDPHVSRSEPEGFLCSIVLSAGKEENAEGYKLDKENDLQAHSRRF